jgi:hypothetical protein
LAYFVGLLYASYPIFCYLYPVKSWEEYDETHVTSWAATEFLLQG